MKPTTGRRQLSFMPTLLSAIENHDVTGCEQLLADGANPNGHDVRLRDQMLGYAASKGAPIEICMLLIRHGAEIAPADPAVVQPLFRAAEAGNVELCKELLARRADPNSGAHSEARPLHIAASGGHAEICEALISAGADVHREAHYWTPLHFAVISSKGKPPSLDVCRALVRGGADPSHRPKSSHVSQSYLTPLQMAAHLNRDEVLSYFIAECGENPKEKTLEGELLIDLASEDTTKGAILAARAARAVSTALTIQLSGASPSNRKRSSLAL
jgi:ankyrin repeat protein